ncbi:sirohydrochlorin chelatase [Aestuariimicrobium ganziense]|uniref:sirohydrochlorin chelatase n=1 Tax=Aestuariimicrobium ganziense TaxID=2773677 RepID=UPI001940A7DC|nr:CbiX/SirB N-terminal domain-containing protein [Aestuariimicrobium ganziense]
MTAPALVLVADGTDDPRVAQVVHVLRKQLQIARPAVSIHLACLGGSPTGVQVVSALAARGASEVVFVPIDLCRAIEASDELQATVTEVRNAHPTLQVSVSRPVGPAPELLTIVDERLRTALRASRTTELDGLVLALPHGGDVRGNALVSRRARQWSAHHRLPVVVAVGDHSGPSVVTALASLRSQGRRHIAVGSVYLADGEGFAQMSEQALAHGAIAVSPPLGAHDRLLDLAMSRYAYAAMDLLDDVEEACEQDETASAQLSSDSDATAVVLAT